MSERERAEFEQYIKSKLKTEPEKALLPLVLARNDCGHYKESSTYLAWDAWMARAASEESDILKEGCTQVPTLALQSIVEMYFRLPHDSKREEAAMFELEAALSGRLPK